MSGFIIALILVFILSIILYTRNTGPDQKPKETPSLKTFPPKTGSEGSEFIPEIVNFFGREEELLALKDLFKEKGLIIVSGKEGVGKTALVAEFAKKHLSKEKIFWYTCNQWTRLEDLLIRLNGLLKEKNDFYFEPVLTDYSLDIYQKVRLLAKRLEGKNLVVIIDQLEEIKDERLKTALGYLVGHSGLTKFILITSGELGNIRQEDGVIFELGEFNLQDTKEFLRSSGVKIEEELVSKILERVGSSALTLQLLSGLLNYYHLRLEEIIERVKGGWVGLFNEITQMLRGDELHLLQQLAACNEPLPEDGIHYLYRRIDLKDILSSLVSCNLLTKEGVYYSIHPQIKNLLYGQLVDKRSVHCALSHYYLDLANLKPFISLILEASHHSIMAGDPGLSLPLFLKESRRMIRIGAGPLLLEHLNLYERGRVSPKDWVRVLGLKGDVYKVMGHLDEAKEAYEEMLKFACSINSRQGMALAYNNLGSIYQAQKEWNLAINYYERGLKTLRETEVIRRKITPEQIDWIYRGKGRWNEAIGYYLNYYQKGLRASKERGDLVGEANSYSNLGSAYQAQGDWNRAIDYYNKALEVLRQLDDPVAEARCYNDLGSVYSAKGDLDRAITYYEKGLEIFEGLDEVAEDSKSLSGLGEVYRERQDYSKSIFYYERNLERLRERGDVLGEARCLVRFANILREMGDIDRSIECIQKSHQIYEELEGKIIDTNFYEIAAATYQAKGDITQAIDHLKVGIEMSIKEGRVRDELNLSHRLAELLVNEGRFDEALTYLNRIGEIAEALGDKDSEVKNYISLGSLFKRKKDLKKAISYFEKAKGLLEKTERKDVLGQIYEELDSIYSQISKKIPA